VYSDQQATRGQAVYKQQCAACHGEALRGAQGPPLTTDDFIRNWNKQPLSELVDKIKNTMPANAPGKLTRQQAADIVAYMLQVGQFPGGRAELGADEASLKEITWPAGVVAERRESAPSFAAGAVLSALGNLAQVSAEFSSRART